MVLKNIYSPRALGFTANCFSNFPNSLSQQ